MTPYYEDESVTIYHGDCREMLPQLLASSLITDPPYGIKYSPGGGGRGFRSRSGKPIGKNWAAKDIVRGDNTPFDPAPLLAFPTVVLFGANHYAERLPSSSEWVVWDKRDGLPSNDFADCELIWTNRSGPARLWSHRWMGLMRDSERGEPRLHPTQKPLVLMRWLVERYSEGSGTILDPYMGSGTTLRAAKDCGRKSVGIELEEQYCEVAARRMAQEVLAL